MLDGLHRHVAGRVRRDETPGGNEGGQLVHARRDEHGRPDASYPDVLRPRADVGDDAPGLLGELVEVLLHPVERGTPDQ